MILGFILLPGISSNAIVKVMVCSSWKWKLMQIYQVMERLVGEIRRTKPTFPCPETNVSTQLLFKLTCTGWVVNPDKACPCGSVTSLAR